MSIPNDLWKAFALGGGSITSSEHFAVPQERRIRGTLAILNAHATDGTTANAVKNRGVIKAPDYLIRIKSTIGIWGAVVAHSGASSPPEQQLQPVCRKGKVTNKLEHFGVSSRPIVTVMRRCNL
jgi:hypothetical protein